MWLKWKEMRKFRLNIASWYHSWHFSRAALHSNMDRMSASWEPTVSSELWGCGNVEMSQWWVLSSLIMNQIWIKIWVGLYLLKNSSVYGIISVLKAQTQYNTAGLNVNHNVINITEVLYRYTHTLINFVFIKPTFSVGSYVRMFEVSFCAYPRVINEAPVLQQFSLRFWTDRCH